MDNEENPPVKGKVDYAKLDAAMDCWPDRWKGFEADVAIGRRIVAVMRPFVASMVGEGLAPTTIRRHWSNLWLLGGELIARTQVFRFEQEIRDLGKAATSGGVGALEDDIALFENIADVAFLPEFHTQLL